MPERFQSESELRKGLEEFEELVQQLCGPPAAENQGHEEQVKYVRKVLRESEAKGQIYSLIGSAGTPRVVFPVVSGCCTIVCLPGAANVDFADKVDGMNEPLVFKLAGLSHALEVRLPFGQGTFVRPDKEHKEQLVCSILGLPEPSLDGFVVIKAKDFLKRAQTLRYQELCQLDPALFVPAKEVKAILFISHIWEKDGNPDETGRQLRGVQKFLDHMKTVMERSAQRDWGVQGLELSHGQFQAAVVVGRGHDGGNEWTGLRSLDDVGVWYDFMCLPQGERDDAEKALFQKSLAGLANFIAHRNVHVVALRFEDEKGKTYEDRGWCQAEFACRVGRPVVYWPERDGHSVTDDEVNIPNGQVTPICVKKMFIDIHSKSRSEVPSCAAWYYDKPQGHADRMEEASFKPPTANRATLMAQRVRARLEKPPLELQHDIDLEVWIPGIMAEFGFHVTNGKDAALVGFMMLYWEYFDFHGIIDARLLFAYAIHRVANDRKVVIKFVGDSTGLTIPWKLKINGARPAPARIGYFAYFFNLLKSLAVRLCRWLRLIFKS